MRVNKDTINTSLLRHSNKNNRNRTSCACTCLITISRIAADTLAVIPVLGLGIGILYIEDLYGVNSRLITIITSIGVVAMMTCSFAIVHRSCNKWLKIEDDEVSIPTFMPFMPH
ncbi:MAG: hypothetical protein KR126chlam5_00532 [Candidatus Anoxychlamydiales bacterium]|nr:hypothetical protein [Candidatus Anoxychlamydiales bacterium]